MSAIVAVLAVASWFVSPVLREHVRDLGDQVATQSETSAAAHQAAAVSHVLAMSAQERVQVQAAHNAVSKCTNVAAGRREFVSVRQARGRALSQAKALEVGQLPRGPELKSALVQALSLSEQADASYVNWAEDREAKSCSKSSLKDRDYMAAYRLSGRAGTAKKKVHGLWLPIATQYGYPVYDRDHM